MGFYKNGETNAFGCITIDKEAKETETTAGVPERISKWTKIRNFLFQDIVVTMTPKQEKVLQEVHDFWHQDAKDFLFQEIKIIDNITL